ncbi:hypothetical protein F5Y18DRAFT_35318 [Xylariaceae sp. FL1019]|nr:hypothetical protein F5Y18DRAFT_35318 [Xylariaceae sp. FL1019]
MIRHRQWCVLVKLTTGLCSGVSRNGRYVSLIPVLRPVSVYWQLRIDAERTALLFYGIAPSRDISRLLCKA